jgi:hypothetical protein
MVNESSLAPLEIVLSRETYQLVCQLYAHYEGTAALPRDRVFQLVNGCNLKTFIEFCRFKAAINAASKWEYSFSKMAAERRLKRECLAHKAATNKSGASGEWLVPYPGELIALLLHYGFAQPSGDILVTSHHHYYSADRSLYEFPSFHAAENPKKRFCPKITDLNGRDVFSLQSLQSLQMDLGKRNHKTMSSTNPFQEYDNRLHEIDSNRGYRRGFDLDRFYMEWKRELAVGVWGGFENVNPCHLADPGLRWDDMLFRPVLDQIALLPQSLSLASLTGVQGDLSALDAYLMLLMPRFQDRWSVFRMAMSAIIAANDGAPAYDRLYPPLQPPRGLAKDKAPARLVLCKSVDEMGVAEDPFADVLMGPDQLRRLNPGGYLHELLELELVDGALNMPCEGGREVALLVASWLEHGSVPIEQKPTQEQLIAAAKYARKLDIDGLSAQVLCSLLIDDGCTVRPGEEPSQHLERYTDLLDKLGEVARQPFGRFGPFFNTLLGTLELLRQFCSSVEKK